MPARPAGNDQMATGPASLNAPNRCNRSNRYLRTDLSIRRSSRAARRFASSPSGKITLVIHLPNPSVWRVTGFALLFFGSLAAVTSAAKEPRRLPTVFADTPAETVQFQFAAMPRREPPLADAPVEEAEGNSLVDRLDALEEKYGDLESSYEDLESAHANLKKSLKGYARTGHSGATMKVNGRIHFDMWEFPNSSPGTNGFESGDPTVSPQDRVGFRRIRFGVKGDLPYNMLYKIEMELAAGNKTEFRDAYLGWKELPFLQTLLIGNQKRPYGLDHLNSSRYNVFIERPYIVEAVNQDARRLGIQSYGVSDDEAWNWRYGVFNQRLVQDEGNYLSDHWQAQIAGRLANTIWYDESSGGRGYAHWGLSGTWADTDPGQTADNFAKSGVSEARFRTRPEARTVSRWIDTGIIPGGDDYTVLGVEGVVNLGAWQLVGEQQNIWMNRTGDPNLHLHGAYVYLSYFLTGEHLPWDRRTGTLGRVKPFENFFLVDTCCDGVAGGMGAWQIAVRWSQIDFSDEDIHGGEGQSVTLGLNWHWTPYARMQFNYIYGDIDDNALNATAGGPDYGNYHVVGTRFMVDF